MSADLVVQIVTGIGATGAIGAAVTALVSRRKTRAEVEGARADAAQVISSAAAALVGPLESRVQDLAQQVQETDRLLREHARWDRQVADTLRELGQEVQEPPPLWIYEPPIPGH